MAPAIAGWLAGAGLLTAFAVLNPLLLGQHFSILLLFIGSVPLLYVGLRFGHYAATYAAVIGFIALLIGHAFLPDAASALLPANSAMYWLRHAVPAVLVSYLMVKRMDTSVATLFSALVAAAVVVTLLSAIILDSDRAELVETMQTTLDDVALQTGQPLPLPANFVPTLVGVMGGFFGVSWLILFIVNIALARWLAVREQPAILPLPSLATLALTPPIMLLTAISVAGALFLEADTGIGYYAANISVVLAIPYLLVGLGVIHALAAGWTYRKIFLWLFYLTSFITPYPLLIAFGMGVVDPVVNFRRWAERPNKE